MSSVRLKNMSSPAFTSLPDLFIDDHMARANGEFVKVYVFLLRSVKEGEGSLDLEKMADMLLCTEKDILRALRYWQKEGLLSFTLDPDKRLTSLELLPVSSGKAPEPEETEVTKPSSSSMTPEKIRKLKEDKNIEQLLYVAEQYLGKMLTPNEVEKLLYFYDELHMSPDLIVYLIEYCVGHHHRSIRYIETVALAWASEGITTVRMAKESSSGYQKEYFTILKAMGVSNRNPVPEEISLMDTWLNQYGFRMDVILEACRRTVLKTGQGSFPYADGILSDWNRRGIHLLSELKTADDEFRKAHKKKEASAKAEKASTGFTNFQERSYDFAEYEKQLLNQ